jgi:hypothetical protein
MCLSMLATVGMSLGMMRGCPMIAPVTAELRVAHLSPDAPNVDVLVDGAVVLQDVPFQAVSSYLTLTSGSHRVQVTPAGDNSTVVIDATVDLAAGQSYTVAARGLLGDGSLAPSVYEDDRIPTPGQAEVRFAHTSPDAPAVDVAVTNGPVLFASVSFPDATEYISVDPGTVDLEVRLAGTNTVALSVPGVTLNADTNYTVFAIGQVGDGTLAALPVVDTP